MNFKDKLFEDAVNVSGGIFTCLETAKATVKAKFQEKIESCSSRLDLVSRNEFNHLLDMMTSIRQEQINLSKKLEEILKKQNDH